MLNYTQALDLVLSHTVPRPCVEVPLADSLGRILQEDLVADRDFPPFDRVCMDGYAVNSADYQKSGQMFDLLPAQMAGDQPTKPSSSNQAIPVMTGAPIPEGMDAVIMVENSSKSGTQVSFNNDSVKSGLAIAPQGEDAKAGDVKIQKGCFVTPSVIAFAASVGKTSLQVSKKVKIAVMSTGTEVVDPADTPKPWQIRDANGPALVAWASSMGAQVIFLGRAIDDEASLTEMITEGLAADILLLSGGVSMGEKDLIPPLLRSLKVEEIFHKAKIKPGKPIWFGKSEGCYVFGLPGNPVSAQAGAKLFVEPLLLSILGHKSPKSKWVQLEIGECFKKKTDREQFVPALIRDSKLYPVPLRGSGDFSNLAQAQGMFQVPGDVFELETGTSVNFMFWGQL